MCQALIKTKFSHFILKQQRQKINDVIILVLQMKKLKPKDTETELSAGFKCEPGLTLNCLTSCQA